MCCTFYKCAASNLLLLLLASCAGTEPRPLPPSAPSLLQGQKKTIF